MNNITLPSCPQVSCSFLDLPVPTSSGWSTIGHLQVGDKVFDENGLSVTIMEASQAIEKPCYDLVFSDGNVIKASTDALWFTWTHAARKSARRCEMACKQGRNWQPQNSPSFVSTQQIKDTLTHCIRGDVNHSIKLCNPLQFPEQDLPIDPYLLGLWLGDGSKHYGHIATDDEEVLESIRQLGYGISKLQDTYSYNIGKLTGKTMPRYCGKGIYRDAPTTFISQLKALNLALNKHVPDLYLYSSIEQRKALLMGLMDTDGTVSTEGACTFDNKNKQLSDAVTHLAVSLGLKVGRREKRVALYGKDCGIDHRVWFTPHIPVFRLSRKLQRQWLTKVKQTQYHRYVVDTYESLPSLVRYFKVSSDSGLFLISSACIPMYGNYRRE